MSASSPTVRIVSLCTKAFPRSLSQHGSMSFGLCARKISFFENLTSFACQGRYVWNGEKIFCTPFVQMMDFRTLILWMSFDEAKLWLTKLLWSWFGWIIGHLGWWLESCDMESLDYLESECEAKRKGSPLLEGKTRLTNDFTNWTVSLCNFYIIVNWRHLPSVSARFFRAWDVCHFLEGKMGLTDPEKDINLMFSD